MSCREFEKDDLTILGIFPGPMDSKLRNKLLDKNKVCEKNQVYLVIRLLT